MRIVRLGVPAKVHDLLYIRREATADEDGAAREVPDPATVPNRRLAWTGDIQRPKLVRTAPTPLGEAILVRSVVISFALLLPVTGLYPSVAHAQNTRADPASKMNTPGMPGGLMNPDDIEKLRKADDRSLALAKAESGTLVGALGLPCEITDAESIGRGHVTEGGKAIEAKLYEVACRNGTGYLLQSGGQSPVATSCFAADATHAADLAEGRKSDLYCQLPANKDIKAMAGGLMSAVGTPCAIKGVRWFGLSTSREIDYTEVSCDDGRGYLLKVPRTSASGQLSAIGCRDAAARGLKCHLTDGGPVSTPVSMQAFRDALKHNGVDCEPSQMRVVGRESVDRRYVVEVQCSERPAGLVAFIPLDDNVNKFEAVDCPAALDRGVTCQFASK